VGCHELKLGTLRQKSVKRFLKEARRGTCLSPACGERFRLFLLSSRFRRLRTESSEFNLSRSIDGADQDGDSSVMHTLAVGEGAGLDS
jgi:hypothetical protein